MRNRYIVLGLSLVLALALSVPAMGGPSNPIASASATAKQIAKKALRRANQANRKATAAQATANTALSNANGAQQSANQAQASANEAETKADAAQTSANNAQASADAANANAETRIQDQDPISGPSSGPADNATQLAGVGCPSGQTILGGGFIVEDDGTEEDEITVGLSTTYGNGWIVQAREIAGQTTTQWGVVAHANCGTK
jgi:hypothetical protein